MDAKQLALLLRPDEVSAITGWCRSKVYADLAAGRLPALKNGRSIRVPREALERWIRENTTGGQ